MGKNVFFFLRSVQKKKRPVSDYCTVLNVLMCCSIDYRRAHWKVVQYIAMQCLLICCDMCYHCV